MVVTIYTFKDGRSGTDVRGSALCECGECLAGHISSSVAWLSHDLLEFKMEIYKKHLAEKHAPEEFCAVTWLDEPMKDEGFKKALELNKVKVNGVA